MKKFIFIVSLVTLLTLNIQAERIYISRLSKTSIFLNQMNTGIYSKDNCAPTSLGMIFNYLNIPYSSISWIRNKITLHSGWIYTSEIEEFLCSQHIDYDVVSINSSDDIVELINNGSIVMLCIDVSKIGYSSDKYIGRSFSGGTGHFITLTGYYKDDEKLLFEVLDPMNSNVRYYDSKELTNAITSWWSFCFTFSKSDVKQVTIHNK